MFNTSVKKFLYFPIDMVCIFFMVFSFGWESTKRMMDAEKRYLIEEKEKLENEKNI